MKRLFFITVFLNQIIFYFAIISIFTGGISVATKQDATFQFNIELSQSSIKQLLKTVPQEFKQEYIKKINQSILISLDKDYLITPLSIGNFANKLPKNIKFQYSSRIKNNDEILSANHSKLIFCQCDLNVRNKISNHLNSFIKKYKDGHEKSIYQKSTLPDNNDEKKNLPYIVKWKDEFRKEHSINTIPNENVKIAIIDGGFTLEDSEFSHVKSKKFNKQSNELYENHGNHVFGIIYAINSKAQFYTYSVYDTNPNVTIKNNIKAINQAMKDKVNYINLSMAGSGYNEDEFQALKKASDSGIQIVISAGNDNQELSSDNCKVFPACYKLNIPNIIVVGAVNQNNDPTSFSNYGEIVDYYFNGFRIRSLGANYRLPFLSGTSQSAPFITGILSTMNHKNVSLISKK